MQYKISHDASDNDINTIFKDILNDGNAVSSSILFTTALFLLRQNMKNIVIETGTTNGKNYHLVSCYQSQN